MRKFILIFLFVFLITPVFVYSADCNSNGATVIYVNGIFTDKFSAQSDRDLLRKKFHDITRDYNVNFINGFNASHLGGIGDLVKSVIQVYEGAGLDYDLTNILRQVHEELSTRKVLLVGHSQGTFYTNVAYDYLVKNGIAAESISVYNVGTPADRVAGGGNYLTSSTDKLINYVVRELINIGYARKPLPANIDIPLTQEEAEKPFGGHSLSGVYLVDAPDRIIGDIEKQLNGLSSPAFSSEKAGLGCFIAPKTDLVYYLQNVGFAVGDTTASAIASVYNNSFSAVRYVYNTVSSGLSYIYNFGQGVVSNLAQIFNSRFFGASLNSTPVFTDDVINLSEEGPQEIKQITEQTGNFSGIGGPIPNKVDIQDQIDDILERIDILKRQIADLKEAEVIKTQATQMQDTQGINNLSELVNDYQQQSILAGVSYPSGGGVVYPKILISEVQIAGLTDSKEEFVELYNPNDTDIDLTSWYLQRKTKTGSDYLTFASHKLFAGKKISANGYFLIARQGYFANLADISVDNPLTDDNSLVLKDPNGQVSDKVGWGQAQDYELLPAQNPAKGQSIGRKENDPLTGSGQERDSDNNSVDFAPNNPTPRAENIIAASSELLLSSTTTDLTAPNVVFNLEPQQNSLTFTINFEITDPLGTVTPSGIDSYIFRWREELGNWQEDSFVQINGDRVSINGTRDFTGNDEKNYYFQIKMKDVAGNESDWLPEIPATTRISIPKKILINEIQIDSKKGVGGTEDDWVELYNPNEVDISLSGWSIQKHSSDDPCSINKSYFKKNFIEEAVISSKGFFLVVDNNASDYLKSIADMTTSWSLSDNNTVYLVKSNDEITDGNDVNIIDKIGFGNKACFSENSPAPSPPEEKSIERKKLGLDTDNNAEDFKISDEPSPKGTFPKVTIGDATDYSSKLSSNSPGAPAYSLLLKWQSSAQNIDSYQVQYKLNDGQWKDWLAKTTQTQEYFQGVYSLFNDNIYQFRAKAQDTDGNLGDWSPELKIGLTNPVLINEIAYAGTNADAKDQWIELYNRTDKDIDLTGWKIVSGSGSGSLNLELSGVIPAKGYFILEKNDDDSLSDILANQLFENPIGKNYFYLRDENNRYVDEFYISFFELDENSFIKDDNHYSIERVSPYSFGFQDKNWKINNGKILNGKDRDENQIYGTPGQQNSVYQLYTYYSFSFIEDTILKKELSPYLFSGMNLQLFKGVNLSIEPGVVIKFYDAQSNLEIKGILKAIGVSDTPIIFTSFKDDEYGGDSNEDKDLSLPEPGNWLGLYFYKESLNSELENVIVRYGGASPSGGGMAVWVDHSSISLKNSVVEKNKNRGLMLSNSNSMVDSVKFLDQNMTDWPSGPNESKAIYIQGGSPTIKNSYFENNSIGIYISSFFDEANQVDIEAKPLIENNNFVKNREPIYFGPLSDPSFINNKATDNSFNAIIFASDITKDMTLKPDLPYLIRNVSVVPENITLTLEPGVVMNFQSNWSGLQINGTLKAIGVSDTPITFRPYYYDNPNILPGNWLGLRFTKTSKNSELENVSVSYGGAFYADPANQDFTSAIKVEQSPISLKNSIIQKNANNGIWLVNSSSIIDNAQFLEQTLSIVSLPAKAVYVQGGKPTIKNSNFKDNYYGIYISDWHNDESGEDVLGEPVLENNQFEGNVKDIFP